MQSADDHPRTSPPRAHIDVYGPALVRVQQLSQRPAACQDDGRGDSNIAHVCNHPEIPCGAAMNAATTAAPPARTLGATVRTWIIRALNWSVDTYVRARGLASTTARTCVLVCGWIASTWALRQRRVLHANAATPADTTAIPVVITGFVRVWYATDSAHTTASLFRFLNAAVQRNLLSPAIMSADIRIVWRDGPSLHHCVINFARGDIELLTGRDIESMRLDAIPCAQL